MENPWKSLSKINPQRENGHRQIGNEIFSALVRADFTVAEYKIVLAIISRTWGFNKLSAPISISKLSEDTGLTTRAVRITIPRLKARRVIMYQPSTVKVNGAPLNDFLFNKHFDTWLDSRIPVALSDNKTPEQPFSSTPERNFSRPLNSGSVVPLNGRSVNKEKHLKETFKETHQEQGCDSEIESRFESFWTSYPTRDGQKTGREKTKALFLGLPAEDQALLVAAAKQYAGSPAVQRGVGIMDPQNFIRRRDRETGEIVEPWREWATVALTHSLDTFEAREERRRQEKERERKEREEEEDRIKRGLERGELKRVPRPRLPFLESEAAYAAKVAAGKVPMIVVPVEAVAV